MNLIFGGNAEGAVLELLLDGHHVELAGKFARVAPDYLLAAGTEHVEKALVDQADRAVGGAEDKAVRYLVGQEAEALGELGRVLAGAGDAEEHDEEPEKETAQADDVSHVGQAAKGH